MNIYGHLMPGRDEQAAAAIEKSLRDAQDAGKGSGRRASRE